MNSLIKWLCPNGLGLRGVAAVTILSPIAALAGLVALSSCTTPQATTVANTAATAVAGAEVALTAADHVGYVYITQRACPPKGPAIWSCSDPKTVAAIKDYEQKAYEAVKQAEAGVVTVQAAMDAINALTAAVPKAP